MYSYFFSFSFILLLQLFSCVFSSTCPRIISRSEWNARSPTSEAKLSINPPPFVVVHHSATGGCDSTDSCKKLVKSIQNYHMDTNGWPDIGYNFLIGGDGSILEGRGWGIKGAHAVPYNARSIGVCLLGNFMNENPTSAQENALQNLIDCGVEKTYVTSDYKLIGHRQASATLCPGDFLYNDIKKWSHFDNNPR